MVNISNADWKSDELFPQSTKTHISRYTVMKKYVQLKICKAMHINELLFFFVFFGSRNGVCRTTQESKIMLEFRLISKKNKCSLLIQQTCFLKQQCVEKYIFIALQIQEKLWFRTIQYPDWQHQQLTKNLRKDAKIVQFIENGLEK